MLRAQSLQQLQESPGISHRNELHLRKAAAQGRKAVVGVAAASSLCGDQDMSPTSLHPGSHCSSCGRGTAAFLLPKPQRANPQQEILQTQTSCGWSLYASLKGRGQLNHGRAGHLSQALSSTTWCDNIAAEENKAWNGSVEAGEIIFFCLFERERETIQECSHFYTTNLNRHGCVWEGAPTYTAETFLPPCYPPARNPGLPFPQGTNSHYKPGKMHTGCTEDFARTELEQQGNINICSFPS